MIYGEVLTLYGVHYFPFLDPWIEIFLFTVLCVQ